MGYELSQYIAYLSLVLLAIISKKKENLIFPKRKSGKGQLNIAISN